MGVDKKASRWQRVAWGCHTGAVGLGLFVQNHGMLVRQAPRRMESLKQHSSGPSERHNQSHREPCF
jgi:hypothetical protein